jgi:hypothetical protein
MNEGLIAQRYPILGAMLKAWQEDCVGMGVLPVSLASHVVRLSLNGGDWRVDVSGAAVDALYGQALAGCAATALAPGKDDLASEAEVAHESGRPLLLEDSIRLPGGQRRVARLYLPLPSTDMAKKTVLCGIAVHD